MVNDTEEKTQEGSLKKPYVTPQLRRYGSVACTTRGGMAGSPENNKPMAPAKRFTG